MGPGQVHWPFDKRIAQILFVWIFFLCTSVLCAWGRARRGISIITWKYIISFHRRRRDSGGAGLAGGGGTHVKVYGYVYDPPFFQAPPPLQRPTFSHLLSVNMPSLFRFRKKKIGIFRPISFDFCKISAPNTLILAKIRSQDPSFRSVDLTFENPWGSYPPRKKYCPQRTTRRTAKFEAKSNVYSHQLMWLRKGSEVLVWVWWFQIIGPIMSFIYSKNHFSSRQCPLCRYATLRRMY